MLVGVRGRAVLPFISDMPENSQASAAYPYDKRGSGTIEGF